MSSEKAVPPEKGQEVTVEVNGSIRKVTFEVSHLGETYLKPTDYAMLGRSDHTQPGINQWFINRNVNYNDTMVHNSWPYVISVNHYSGNLASQAKYHYLTSTWTTNMFYQLKVDAENITGLATGAQKDPWIVPIFHTGTDPDADDGGWVNMSLYQNYITDQEVADIKAGTHYANAFYGVSATEYTSSWSWVPNDGYLSEIQGHWDFSRRAAHKFLGLPGTGDLRTEYTVVGNVAIATAWENQWIADGDVGGPLDTYAAYDYSLLTGNGPVTIWVKLDVYNSTADKVALWFWSQTWGAEFLFVRYLQQVGIEKNLMAEREDWYLNGTFSPLNGDIHERMTTVYHMTAWNDKQAYNNPTWMLEPQHIDYTAERLTDIYISQFDPYYWTYYADLYRPTRMCYTPGVSAYGQRVHYWNTPMTWNLTADQTLTIKLPSASQNGWGIEPYWSANFSVPGNAAAEMRSNGQTGEFVLGHGYPATLYSTTYYDPATKTITIPGASTWPLNPNPAYPNIAETGSPLFFLDISPVSHYGLSIVEPGPYMAGQAYTLRVTPLNVINGPASCNQTVQLPAVAGVTYGASSHTFAWGEASWTTTVVFAASGQYPLVSQDAYFYLDISDTMTVSVGGTPANRPPTVDLASEFTVEKRVTNTFIAAASDPDNDSLMFTWDWGDRKSDVTYTNSATHAYTKKGTYLLTVTVDDQTGIAGHIVSNSANVIVVDSLPPPPATVGLGILGLPSTVDVGSGADFLVRAYDSVGAVSTGYRGTVNFITTDMYAVLPSDYTFVAADAGEHWFTGGQLVFHTPGNHFVAVYDVANSEIGGNTTITVVDPRVTLLNETFDSWSSLEEHWVVANSTNPLYNNISMVDGVMLMTDLYANPVNDNYNAVALWDYPMSYDTNLTVSFRIWLPFDDSYKEGIYGQFVALRLDDGFGNERLFVRFLMDNWGGAPSGFTYITESNTWGKISGFAAGWHNCSISLLKGSSTWIAGIDGSYTTGLTFSGSPWNASDLSRITIINALREEPVEAMMDDVLVARVGPQIPPPETNTPPVADFVVWPYVGNLGTTFSFNGSLSHDAQDPLSALKFRWDWEGDGLWDTGWSSSPYGSHSFSAGGTYEVILQVTDTGGLTGMTNRTVIVDAGAPFAVAGPDIVVYGESDVILSAEGSFDPETMIVDYVWTYSDYNGPHVYYGAQVIAHIFAPWQEGVFVTLTVTDEGGNTATDVCVIDYWWYSTTVLKYSGKDSGVMTAYNHRALASGNWSIFIENYGLRSVDIEVLEIWNDNWTSLTILETTIKFQNYNAYPYGTVYLPDLFMQKGLLYQVTVTPSGQAGKYANFRNAFYSANQPPTPQMSAQTIGDTVHLSSSGSWDRDSDPMRFVWDFGDGTKSYGATVSHSYDAYGTYLVGLRVYDDVGNTADAYMSVNVTSGGDLPPVPVITVVSISGRTVTVDASGSYDPDGGLLWYSWTWGDGTPPTVPTTVPTASHNYASTGMYTIRLQVIDDMGASALAYRNVTVGGPIPPFMVWGYTYNGTLDPYPNCIVTLTNLRTGGSLSNVSDPDFAYYMIDLNAVPGGWVLGDIVRISAVKDNNAASVDVYLTNESMQSVNLQIDLILRMVGPPPVPYSIWGWTYGPNASLLSNCTVTVTNLRTGMVTNVVDVGEGYYMIDLWAVQGGWALFDTLVIAATWGELSGSSATTILDPNGPVIQVDLYLQ